VASSAAHVVAAGGNETARLYDKYARQLYRYCLARLRSPEEAEDAVQNTFMRVHGALCKGTTPHFEAAWLYKIAHNVCLTRVEVRGRRAEHELASDFDELDVAAPETEHEALIGLEAALASMPKNLRDAILLREWQGLSYAEIAESLDTSVPAVETLIFRARRHLASALQPAGVGLLDVGALYGAIRVLLARLRGGIGALGPAKVAAVAAVALGTAGVTTVVSDVEAHPPAHDRAPATAFSGAVPAANVTVVSPPPRARAHGPTSTRAGAAPAHPAATRAPATGIAEPAATKLPAASPAPPPSTTTTVPAATPTRPVVETTPTVVTSTAASIPTVSTPAVTTPTVQAPTVETPTVQTPTVSVPTVTQIVPALPVTVSVPTATLPRFP
jgi:RNA polymerase sigma factor (sigma-70 family)